MGLSDSRVPRLCFRIICLLLLTNCHVAIYSISDKPISRWRSNTDFQVGQNHVQRCSAWWHSPLETRVFSKKLNHFASLACNPQEEAVDTLNYVESWAPTTGPRLGGCLNFQDFQAIHHFQSPTSLLVKSPMISPRNGNVITLNQHEPTGVVEITQLFR